MTVRIALLAVPYEDGRRSVGTGLGPARLLESGLAHELRAAGHDVRETMVELPVEVHAPLTDLARIVALQGALATRVHDAMAAEEFPIVLAGNCSSAVGTLSACPADTVVVWFDAHGDFNTPETTITGKVDGMALAMATGRCHADLAADVSGFTPVDERRVLLVGARDLDPLEEAALNTSPIQRVAANDVRSVPARVRAMGQPAPPVYIHLDLDVLDPADARANRYGVPGGLSRRALAETMEALSGATRIAALAVTAYDPAFDRDGQACKAAVQAVCAAVPRTTTTE